MQPAGAVSLREASARDVPNLRTRYRACDHSNPLTIHPPSLFYTTHLHNPPTTLIYHPSHPLSTTTTSPHELHIPPHQPPPPVHVFFTPSRRDRLQPKFREWHSLMIPNNELKARFRPRSRFSSTNSSTFISSHSPLHPTNPPVHFFFTPSRRDRLQPKFRQ